MNLFDAPMVHGGTGTCLRVGEEYEGDPWLSSRFYLPKTIDNHPTVNYIRAVFILQSGKENIR
jgi:hypothetical protein